MAGGVAVHVYHSPINLGKGAAVRIVWIRDGRRAADPGRGLELDPREYGSLLAPLQAGIAEVVYGSRFQSTVRVPKRTRWRTGS